MKIVKADPVTLTEPPVAVVDAPMQESSKQSFIEPPTRAGFNQPLTAYDLKKDRQIGVAGVVQAVIGSEWYGRQASLTDLSNQDEVAKLRTFVREEIEYWLSFIQQKSESGH